MKALGFALLLLGACSGPGQRPYGESVGDVAASLSAAETRAPLGKAMKFQIVVKNQSETQTFSWPDMNDPRCWVFGFTPVSGDPVWFGCTASVEGQEGLTLQPSQIGSLIAVLPRNWGGWSQSGKKEDGTLTARAVDFPPPGRYRVKATYQPAHAQRPALRQLPGWGVSSNSVELEVFQ